MPPLLNVFISHTTQDERDFALAHDLAAGLRERGAQVWIAPDNIPAGAQWEQEIISSVLEKCTHFLVILSAASIGSEWVLKEIGLAQQRYSRDHAFSILPLRVGQVKEFPFRAFIQQFQELKYHQHRLDQLDEVVAALDLPLVMWPQYLRALLRGFEYVDLSQVDGKKLSMESFLPINLTAEHIDKDKIVLKTFGLMEALSAQPKTLVIGPGGSGKTTALRWCAFKLAKQGLENNLVGDSPQISSRNKPIPILVELSRYEGSLINQLKAVLETREIKSSEKTFIEWIKQGQIFLLLDGFDEVNDKRRFITELEELTLRAPSMRVALTSRADQALINHPLADFKRYDVDSLDDAHITAIFQLRLGHENAEALFRMIESQHLLEVFRRPLMAWLISSAYDKAPPEHLPLAKGVLYQTVIDKRILRIWEAKHNKELVDYKLPQKIKYLARIGYEMVLNNVPSLEEEEVEKICLQENIRGGTDPTEMVAKLLGQLYTTGIVKNAEGKVQFWHLSFRDYFAAVWLKNHFNPRKLLRLSWEPQWHNALIMLVGLLEEYQAKTLLKWMLRLVRISLYVIAVGPRRWATNQLFLTISCLCNTRQSYTDLKDSFIKLITGRTLYLSAASIPIEQILYYSGIEKIYYYFYMLVGQLGTKRSLEYLQEEDIGRRAKICGLAQFRQIKYLFEELKETPDTDSLADQLAAYFILMYPLSTLLSEFGKFFAENDAAPKKRFLEAINSLVQSERGSKGRYKHLGQDEEMVRMFMKLALYDDDSEVRDKAFSICRAFGKHQFYLPAICEHILIQALKEEEETDVCERALWYLVYATSPESLEFLIAALDSNSQWEALHALDALKHRDRDKFPYHQARFLKRFFGVEFEELEQFQILRRSIQSNATFNSEKDADIHEMISFLLGGACLPDFWLIRSFSVEALFLLRFEFIAPYLGFIFVSDEHENVREEALVGLTYIMEEKAETFIHKAFEDSSQVVRKAAIQSFYRMPDELRVRALPRLRELMEGDSDEEVRRLARSMVERSNKN